MESEGFVNFLQTFFDDERNHTKAWVGKWSAVFEVGRGWRADLRWSAIEGYPLIRDKHTNKLTVEDGNRVHVVD